MKKFFAKVGASAVAAAVLSSPVYAAIDTTGVTDELTSAGVAATAIIGGGLVFAGIVMAGFALYRKVKGQ